MNIFSQLLLFSELILSREKLQTYQFHAQVSLGGGRGIYSSISGEWEGTLLMDNQPDTHTLGDSF